MHTKPALIVLEQLCFPSSSQPKHVVLLCTSVSSFQHVTPSKIQSGGVRPFFANREDWPLSRVSITWYAPAMEFSSEMPLQWNLIASDASWFGGSQGVRGDAIDACPFRMNNFGSIEFIASQGRFSKPGLSWLNSLTHVFFFLIPHCCNPRGCTVRGN